MDFISISKDVMLLICTYLDDGNVINLFSTCTDFYKYSKIYKFNEFHSYNKVIKRSYYENFLAIKNYIEGNLHDNIKKLCFVDSEEWIKINDSLPDSIDYLEFNVNLIASLQGKLPTNVKELVFKNISYQILPKILPQTLISLTIKYYDHLTQINFPESLQELNLNANTCLDIIFPKNLKKLKLFIEITVGDIDFPNKLTYLDYNKDIIKFLPDTLESLTLYYSNTYLSVLSFIPCNLKNLYLFDIFSSPYDSVNTCNFFRYVDFSHFIKKLPENIEYIEFACSDNLIKFHTIILNLIIPDFEKISESKLHHKNSFNSLFFIRKVNVEI